MSESTWEYGEGREPIPAIGEPTVIFVINKTLPQDSWTEQDVYHATRCSWVIGENARERAFYALGVSHGVVRGAYRITGWYNEVENRWCFEGDIAKNIDVVGTSVARLKPRPGASNPVRLFLDGISAPAPD